MISKLTKILIFTLIAMFGVATAALAVPPPVNQNVGFLDTMFNNLLEADCRGCHGPTPPPGVPVDTTYLPNRHHLNVGSTVPVGSCQETPNTCVTDADCYDFCDITTTVMCTTDADCPIDPATGTNEPCIIGENYCVGESERPYPSGDTAGNYDCYSCHQLVWDPDTMSSQMAVFRDCNICHKAQFQPDHPDRVQELNQHHRVAKARAGECSWCHGSLVQDGVLDSDGDGYADRLACDDPLQPACNWIPTYQPSLVTPWPSEKNFGRCDEICANIDPVTLQGTCSVGGEVCAVDADCGGSDTQCVVDANCPIAGEVCNLDLNGGGGGMANARGVQQGNCNYCHDSSTTDTCDIVSGTCVAAPSTACLIDADCNGPILINHDTHHFTGATGLVPMGAACFLCHGGLPDGSNRTPSHTSYDIRGCEKCHGFPSLHNIQVDSNGDGMIMPGGEMPYYGHIGSNTDCNGCHGFSVAVAPGTGPVIPFINSADDLTVTAGADATVTLTGVALTNMIDTGSELIELASDAELTAADGSVTSIIPDSVAQSEIVVTLSGLSAGQYHLRAVKASKASNPVVVAVTDAVTMTATDCNRKKGTLTIDGSGFGTKPEGTDEYINVQVDGQAVDVTSWSDTQIQASVSSCSKRATITVNALYGSASNADSGGGGGNPDKPCKGKGCNK